MNEARTNSYFLVNLTLTYRIVQGPTTLDLYVKGMNLTNEDAREHTSVLKDRVPLPGRGIVVVLKLRSEVPETAVGVSELSKMIR